MARRCSRHSSPKLTLFTRLGVERASSVPCCLGVADAACGDSIGDSRLPSEIVSSEMVSSVLSLAAVMAAPGCGDEGSERVRVGGVLVSLSAPRTPPSVPRASRAGRTTLGTGIMLCGEERPPRPPRPPRLACAALPASSPGSWGRAKRGAGHVARWREGRGRRVERRAARVTSGTGRELSRPWPCRPPPGRSSSTAAARRTAVRRQRLRHLLESRLSAPAGWASGAAPSYSRDGALERHCDGVSARRTGGCRETYDSKQRELSVTLPRIPLQPPAHVPSILHRSSRPISDVTRPTYAGVARPAKLSLQIRSYAGTCRDNRDTLSAGRETSRGRRRASPLAS
eukprot:scaffold29005_cov36-Phaeocystis_antarctica.AAC.2